MNWWKLQRLSPVLCAAVLLAGALSHGDPRERGEMIDLPKPDHRGATSIEETIARRRSVRTYSTRALTLKEVSQLLWAAQGITGARGKRAVPSAGALYPLEVYVAVGKVDGLPAGLYHYRPGEHKLRLVRKGDVRVALARAAWRQACVREAPAVLLVAAVYSRTARKYGGRAKRYVHMEVGCVCQNVYLQCEALKLGTVAVGAFSDRAVERILGEAAKPLLLMPVGAKTGAGSR